MDEIRRKESPNLRPRCNQSLCVWRPWFMIFMSWKSLQFEKLWFRFCLKTFKCSMQVFNWRCVFFFFIETLTPRPRKTLRMLRFIVQYISKWHSGSEGILETCFPVSVSTTYNSSATPWFLVQTKTLIIMLTSHNICAATSWRDWTCGTCLNWCLLLKPHDYTAKLLFHQSPTRHSHYTAL